ncbi:MAG: hypothetical protein E5Y63_28870 [Mesorhizobium sp.]|uniref:ATP-binding protein n=1 Tax=Mesorhizobium sp. TaxID=1871066 RepID=UPI00121A89DB|nr:ATP-binding protein [Mesorhizobium sp.]TIM26512.1 MAG: hypothetical protein E5Y63_28870 [Mesorhizobium sp.]
MKFSNKTSKSTFVGEPEIAFSTLLATLRHFVDELAITDEVLRTLLPGGSPHNSETALWDYKENIPVLPPSPKDEDRKKHKAELGDIIKDVLAFHNAYGGYIVFGVADKGKNRVRGCSGEFDCGDLNKRLQSYTDTNIECLYREIPLSQGTTSVPIGLLLVPRRASGLSPVRFRKEGPEKPNGGRSFGKETYIRVRDECRPATATSEDWAFLHSPRDPPEHIAAVSPRRVQCSMPPRDPDLITFVGRDGPLSELRRWLTDARSPVRLITGIGGLGKTTLASRFAEEVIETGAGEIEWVIWLTAKQQTFSALLGKMVPTGKVDFGDLVGLYSEILSTLAYKVDTDDDDQSVDEITDNVVEAVSIYSCLLIVDDIDSLAPDQQKEVVAALNAVALRTVGRDIAPTRVLLTSRIDQGLPQTAVIKISGLERPAFDEHVVNLCATFRIPPITGTVLNDFFEATSGSPLFAASIVRLVSLGENIRDAVDTWRGQEGEDVRKFAFEREIKRLDTAQGRLLYAVLLLGETSINDLASVLEVTPKVVRERIAELQAYHLIAISTKDGGDSSIFAPTDLIAVTAILRAHLSTQATTVETACARAQERSKNDSRSIGLGIRSVLNAWEAGQHGEAVILAEKLKQKFPTSGDAASMLGAALLRASPPRLKEADRALEEARKLGCMRSELLTNTIRVKSDLQDWQGIHTITRNLTTKESNRDEPLDAFLFATKHLIVTANLRGDRVRTAELAIEAVEKITMKVSRQRLDHAYFSTLNSARFDFARVFINALEAEHTRPGDKLNVFEGVVRLSDSDVILIDLLRLGLTALETWWSDVEGRPVVDMVACSILGRQLRRMEKIQRQLHGYSAKQQNTDEIARRVRELAHRGARLAGDD